MKHATLIGVSLALFLLIPGSGQPNADLDTKIGQMIMAGFRGLELTDDNPITADLEKRQIGAVILFDYDVPSKTPVRNIASAVQVRRLTEDLRRRSRTPLIIAIDQEGGRVNRLKERFGFPSTISAKEMAVGKGTELTERYAEQTAKLLADLGINLNYAPVVDLNTNPENPVIGRIERSFSGDPSIVTEHAAAWISAHKRRGILSALKHFPGHGSSRADSHLGFVDVTDTWKAIELQPYRSLIDDGVVDIVMTAHIFNSRLDAKYPATLSKTIVSGLLRGELKYDGVVVSDDMQMKAISAHYGLETAVEQAINAGVDMLVFGNNAETFEPDIAERAVAAIKSLVANGRISRQRIDESYARIMKLKGKMKQTSR